MKNFEDVLELAKQKELKTISVACCHDKEVLLSVEMARKIGIANAILIGDINKTIDIANELGIDIYKYQLINETNEEKACSLATKLILEKKADMLMKGLVDTSVILKAVLDKEYGIKSQNVLSHIALFDIDTYDKVLIITDAAMNIAPDLKTKKQIIENACTVAKSLNISTPKVAVLCAKEKVNPKMKDTVEAKQLQYMYETGEIKGCIVGGPFALDNAISKEAAIHKGINHPVAGEADILLTPDIEAGNILYKSLVYFSKSKNAGVIVGAKAPIILTSRADSEDTKLNSIALGALIASNK